MANGGIAFTEQQRVAGAIRDVLNSLRGLLHEDAMCIGAAGGEITELSAAVGHVVADAPLEIAPASDRGSQAAAEMAVLVQITIRIGVAGALINGQLKLQ